MRPHLEDTTFDLAKANARLFVQRPNAPAVEIRLTQSEFVIGRQTEQVDLVLDDDLVSKRHAKLSVDARGYFTLEDLGSKNGIEYAGRRIQRLNLVDGDVFRIGRTELRFEALMPRIEKSPPVVNDSPASIMAEVEVPAPASENLDGDSQVGWDPDADDSKAT